MRSIKFRAWDKVEQEMFNPETENNNEMFFVGLVNGKLRCSETQYDDGDDFILMQYTGLKDKNGKEIYEGDALKLGFSGISGKGYVYWCKNTGQWWIKDARENVKERNKGRIYPLYQPAKYEVIGNIYEHPHLLEESTWKHQKS